MTEKLQAIHDITCLRAQHSLQTTMADKWMNKDSLLNSMISRKRFFSEIEDLLNYMNISFATMDESKTVRGNQYVLCGGDFKDNPVTLITTDMTHREVLHQTAERMTIPHEDIKSFHRLEKSLHILKILPKQDNIVSILAYQITPFPVFFVFEASYQMSLADELEKETEKTLNYASTTVLLSILKQAISAILHCHKNGIILRNINTSKFLISGEKIKLFDLSDAIQLTTKREQRQEG